MGKGQRVRAGRAAEKEAKKIAAIKAAKKKKITTIIASVIAIVLVVGIVGGFVYTNIYNAAFNRGEIQRKTVVMESDNYTVDAAMMSYFYYTKYNSFLNTYSSMLSSIGLDTSVSLKKQDCALQSGSSWFDYFATETGTMVKEYLYRAENAIDAEMKLEDEDNEIIQKIIDNYKAMAEAEGYDYDAFISAAFGTGVKESDVQKCLELATLADKYYQQYYAGLEYTDAEIEAYYKENIDTYRYVDYYTYAVSATDVEDSTTYAAAKAKAEKLADVKSVDAFKAWIKAEMEDAASITKDYTQEDLDADIEEALTNAYHENATLTEDDEASEWLFNDAKVGKTYITDDEKGTYTVYYCVATPHRDEELTRTIRNIVLTNDSYEDEEACKEQAVSIMAEMTEAGLTDETFEKYAAEYSENSANYTNGGLCENYKESAFEANMGAWAFDEDRKKGDFEIVKYDDGYAICYYIGKGIEAWKSDCITDKRAADYSAAVEKWAEEIAITENEKGYNKIPDNA